MHREPHYLTAEIPGQGRRPPMRITLHAEDDALVLAVDAEPGHRAPKHAPGRATRKLIERLVSEEVGECSFGSWEPYEDLDGSPAGWMTTVAGPKVKSTVKSLG